MFILSYISSGLEFSSVNHTSIYENSELKVFKNKIFSRNDLLGTNIAMFLINFSLISK